MKDGLYRFQFGSNQDINIFYFHKRWNLQWSPGIQMNDIELLRSSLASPVTFQLKLNYSGFRYCMNHAFKNCKSNKHLNIKNFIKCRAFFPHLLGKNSSLTKTDHTTTQNRKIESSFPLTPSTFLQRRPLHKLLHSLYD